MQSLQNVALAGLIALFAYAVKLRFFHSLSRFPLADPLAGVSDFWAAKEVYHKRMHLTLRRMHDEKGEFVRIGPNHVSITAAPAIAALYLKGSGILKSSFYDGLYGPPPALPEPSDSFESTAITPNLFGMRGEDLHRTRRRQLAHAFSQATVLDMESTIDIHLRKLRRWVDDCATSHDTFDIKEGAAAFVIDTLGDLAFSRPFGTLDSRSNADAPPIALHLHLAVTPAQMPWTLPIVRKIGRWLPVEWIKEGFRGRDFVRKVAEEQTARMIANPSKRVDILSSLINAKDPETGEKLSEGDIAAEAFGFQIAGTHTTAVTILLMLFYLLHADNRHVLEKLLVELDDRLTPLTDADTVYSWTEVNGLPYLNACLKETHRMAGVFNMSLPKIAPEGGLTIAGEYFEAGTILSVSNYALHYNKNIFGADVDVFRPERYLEQGGSKLSEFVIPFSVGHRACIGRNIAQTEILKSVSTLLRNYTLDPLDPHEVLKTESVGVSEKVGGLPVHVKRRA